MFIGTLPRLEMCFCVCFFHDICGDNDSDDNGDSDESRGDYISIMMMMGTQRTLIMAVVLVMCQCW